MKYLVLALLILGGCAHPGPIPAAARANNAQTEAAPQQPSCEPNKVCHYRFDDEVTPESTAGARAGLLSAEKVGAKVFVLEINTPGGNVGSGFRLAKAIEESSVPVVCIVDGRAASMGFYILASCPMRVMTRRSTLMIHEPQVDGNASGPTNDWRNVADMLAVLRVAMAVHCNKRMTSSMDEYRARTDGGKAWWFDWKDAKHYNAVDVVIDTVDEVLEELRKP